MKYKGIGEYACERCNHLMYDDYGIVRNYLEVNPGATSATVSRATGVSEGEIKNMLREEKLEIREDSRTFLQCEGCGKAILSGRYCEACSKIAVAAAKKKREREALEEKKDSMFGVATDINIGEEGRKRFLGYKDE
ncbi:MAG: flagellar protein [Lachnospiraceae bacterium]|nr:flagellar protein [Lachnospiraceae bacterium]